jgi:acetyltransferase
MWRYTSNLRSLYETPLPSLDVDKEGLVQRQATTMLERVRQSGRTLLTEFESKQLLTTYGIPTVETRVARSETEAVTCAQDIGYPVVLKLHSETISHKTDVGGVQLRLSSADQVRSAYRAIEGAVSNSAGPEHFQGVTVQPMVQLDGYELIVGSSLDPQFGPVLLFGSGGQLVEVYRDHALALPPLTTTGARQMMEQTRVFAALGGVRGRSCVDLAALEQLLVRFSSLVAEQRQIKEIDINPLLASQNQFLALDARVILHSAEISEDELPKLAIRPYPLQYVYPCTLQDGTPVTLRPIRPEDELLMVNFHKTLSDRSVYLRWLHLLGLSQRVAHERLIGVCFLDYDREMAFVADYHNPQTKQHEILGVGRIIKAHDANEAEFALLITDQFQGRGLGTELLRQLIQFGRDEKLQRLTGDILLENQTMQKICQKLGFRLQYLPHDHLMHAELEL